MRHTEYAVDYVFAVMGLGLAAIFALFVFDAVQEHRAWPYTQACHQARLLPDRRPLSASVACLPTTEVP